MGKKYYKGIKDLSWKDREISGEHRKEIYKRVTKTQNRDVLVDAAYAVNEYAAPYVVESIERVDTDTCRSKSGYDTLLCEKGILCAKNSFYGYRRRVLIMADRMLRLRSIE